MGAWRGQLKLNDAASRRVNRPVRTATLRKVSSGGGGGCRRNLLVDAVMAERRAEVIAGDEELLRLKIDLVEEMGCGGVGRGGGGGY
jgi:hypothetical protein